MSGVSVLLETWKCLGYLCYRKPGNVLGICGIGNLEMSWVSVVSETWKCLGYLWYRKPGTII